MYTQILVPLDGSELAECVLPYVKWFTEVSSVNEIVLLRVVEPFHISGGLEDKVEPQEKERIEGDAIKLAEGYLDNIAGQFKETAIKINRVVTVGRPAKTITDYVSQSDVDLIIMATHAYSGVHRLVHGSVAEEILRAARAPLFLVTPKDRPPDRPDA
ncbi:MAG: universal stress protein [Dehalococcoidales bacterium]|jgi:nucleotide-binding universal stress UspA family protein